jgi:small-conductance mechanosensitive channel
MGKLNIDAAFDQFANTAFVWLTSTEFYSQLGLLLLATLLAFWLSAAFKKHSALLRQPAEPGPLETLRNSVYQTRSLLLPLLLILFYTLSVDASQWLFKQSQVLRFALTLALLFMLYTIINRLVAKQFFRRLAHWVILPIILLEMLGWLGSVIGYLESLSIQLGSISISLYGVLRVVFFGSILFWLGRLSNNAAQQVIRSQHDLDIRTREVFAKLFQVVLFSVVFILLLEIMGVNLTALAVFGGAVGVGLGFGLQAIASNFISGIIILMDRSLSVGDYIEMEDGRSGIIRELNMRSTQLETFDGKVIMVPNEQFITSSFTNWTHNNIKQRYSLEFGVAYDTDLHQLFAIIRDVVASHPKVLSGDAVPLEERPDAEISRFDDYSVKILVEFWMEGIDDGANRVGADLLLMIWDALKQHGIKIPFPQREVTIRKQ